MAVFVVTFSFRKTAAMMATLMGCESMMMLPRLAPVRWIPSARKPWKQVPSTKAKARIFAQSPEF